MNGISERIHLVLTNNLRTFKMEEEELPMQDPWSTVLASAAWAIRSRYQTVQESMPVQSVFGGDTILPIQFKADLGNHKRNTPSGYQCKHRSHKLRSEKSINTA